MKLRLTTRALILRKYKYVDYFTDGTDKGISIGTFRKVARGKPATLPMLHRVLDILNVPETNRDQFIEEI
jgi:hypothetical protein